jgi:hypothetical protein
MSIEFVGTTCVRHCLDLTQQVVAEVPQLSGFSFARSPAQAPVHRSKSSGQRLNDDQLNKYDVCLACFAVSDVCKRRVTIKDQACVAGILCCSARAILKMH